MKEIIAFGIAFLIVWPWTAMSDYMDRKYEISSSSGRGILRSIISTRRGSEQTTNFQLGNINSCYSTFKFNERRDPPMIIVSEVDPVELFEN